jgi:hypothetical protein
MVSSEFFDWNRDPLNPKTSQAGDFLKPYDLLRHAKKRLDEVDDKENPVLENLTLGDCVSNLRGAIEHREKQLKDKFSLAELFIWEASKGKNIPVYEKLLRLGITQPILQKKLIDLRNFVIHQQKYPFNKEKSIIIELHEFAWYFIRSTDSFLARDISGTIFYPPNFSEDAIVGSGFDFDDFSYTDHFPYDGCFFISVFPKHEWQIEIRGYGLPINLFSKEEKKDWLELVVSHFDDSVVDEELGLLNPYDDSLIDTSTDEWRERRFDKYSSSGDNIKHFEGTWIGPPAALRYMIKEYFKLYMYY